MISIEVSPFRYQDLSTENPCLALCNEVLFAAPLNHWFYDIDMKLFEPFMCVILLMVRVTAEVWMIIRERRMGVL